MDGGRMKGGKASGYAVAFSVGAVLGAVYYNLVARYHVDRIELHWLGRLTNVYVLGGYDIVFYEYMLDFGIAAVALFFLWRLTGAKS
jgi:hypothetical protein